MNIESTSSIDLSSLSVQQLAALYEDHVCQLSPDSGCEVCYAYWDMRRDEKYNYSTSDALSDYEEQEVRSL